MNVDLDKANQDSYYVPPSDSFYGRKDRAFFGVFDGHGSEGDHCSIFTKKWVRSVILRLRAAM